jgi:hypothetical protein
MSFSPIQIAIGIDGELLTVRLRFSLDISISIGSGEIDQSKKIDDKRVLIQYKKEKKKKKTACLGSLLFRLETNQIFGLSSFTHLSLKARPLSLPIY